MLSATEARQATDRVIESATGKALSEIEKAIDDSINNSEYSVTLNKTISDEVKRILEVKGYKIEQCSQYNELYTKISW